MIVKCKSDCNCGRHSRADHLKTRKGSMFVCPSCNKKKPIEDWFIRRGGSRGSVCKACHAEDGRRRRLKTLFSLSVEEYDNILIHQNGACFVCKKKPKNRRLAVDHDHKTGLVRGLLCWRCNSALGKFDDDPVLMERGAEYLRYPPATIVLKEERFGRKGRTSKKTIKRKRKK